MMYSRKKTSVRNAAATVELAVCLPVIVIIVMGSLSATSMIFLRAAVVQSAYEVIREAVKRDGDVNLALERGEAVLSFRNIEPESITLNPANVADQPPGTEITVTVVASSSGNGIFAIGPFAGQTIEVQSVMLKE